MSQKTIHPNHRRDLYEALSAALAARTQGTPAEACAKIASHCREQWARRLDPNAYRCERTTLDGATVWVASGPCSCRFEFSRLVDGTTACLSDSGETYQLRDETDPNTAGNRWKCGCEAFGNSEDAWCKHLAGWLAVRTAARTESRLTHTARRETPSAPAPCVYGDERNLKARAEVDQLRSDMGLAAA